MCSLLKIKKRCVLTVIVLLMVLSISSVSCYAHSGNTDSKGGHYNRSTGEYHYHHGHPAHQHTNGVCPYENSPNSTGDNKIYTTNSTEKAVAKANSQTSNSKPGYYVGAFAAAGIGGYLIGNNKKRK